MKKFKRQYIIVIFCIFACLNTAKAIEVTVGDLCYSLNGAYASVTGLSNQDIATVNIPEQITYDGLTYIVNAIGGTAFSNSKIKYLKLPNTITTIGTFAFSYCKELVSMIFPKHLNSMYSSSFGNCDLLREFIYLSPESPNGWSATSRTYVPNKVEYQHPPYEINEPTEIIEMISFGNSEFEYTGNKPTPAWKNNVEGYQAELLETDMHKDVGEWCDTLSFNFTKDAISFIAKIPYHYSINPVNLTAKIENAQRFYGDDNPEFKIIYSGFVGTDNESNLTELPVATTSATKESPVGTYPITIKGGNAKNYTIAYEPGILTINKAPLSVKPKDCERFYGDPNSFELQYSGLKNNETEPTWLTYPKIETDATLTSPIGNYIITITDGVAENYEITTETGMLSVNPAPLTFKVSNTERPYFEENNLHYNVIGFKNNENENDLNAKPQISTTATLSSPVGSYPVHISGAKASNYIISYEDGTMTITKRILTVSTPDYRRVYLESNPEDIRIDYSGFVNNENESILIQKPVAEISANENSDAGIYPITIYGGEAQNYAFNYTGGHLIIDKAEQTLEWEQDLSNINQGEQVELTATSSSGLEVEYLIADNDIVSLYKAGLRTFLDCYGIGEIIIRAVQNGNNNYYPSERIAKTATVKSNAGILENKIANEVILSPNPTKGLVKIKTSQKIENVEIISMQGQIIRQFKPSDEYLNLADLQFGIYFIRITTSNGTSIHKLIKE